jgi:hypothetical protein
MFARSQNALRGRWEDLCLPSKHVSCGWRATRPLHFFRADGSMPEAVEMPLTIPPELGPAEDVLCTAA